MRLTRAFFALLLSTCLWATALAASDMIRKLEDWEEVRQVSSGRNVPVVLFVDQTDCPYCEIVEQDFLNPVLISGEHDQNAIFRRLVIDSGETLMDESGNKVTTREFAKRYTDPFTPTILFLDSDAREVTDSLVGLRTPDFYGFYLDRGIRTAHTILNDGELN